MQKCPHCAEMIQDEAKVCPHCQRKLGMGFGQIGCLVFAGLLALAYAAGPKDQKNTANTILAADRACEAQTGQRCSVP